MAPPIIVVGGLETTRGRSVPARREKSTTRPPGVPEEVGRAVLLAQEPLGVEVLGGLEDPRDLAGREDDADPDAETGHAPGQVAGPVVAELGPDGATHDRAGRVGREAGGEDGEGEGALRGLGRVVPVVHRDPRDGPGAGRGGQHGVQRGRGERGGDPGRGTGGSGRGAGGCPGQAAAHPGRGDVEPCERGAHRPQLVDVEAAQVRRVPRRGSRPRPVSRPRAPRVPRRASPATSRRRAAVRRRHRPRRRRGRPHRAGAAARRPRARRGGPTTRSRRGRRPASAARRPRPVRRRRS